MYNNGKLNLELQSSANATTVAVAKITREWDGGSRKSVFLSFLADQKIMTSWKKCFWGHPIA